VVAYKLHALTYWIARRLGMLKSKFFSLPNKLAGRELVPELEQAGVTPAAIAAAIAPAFAHGLAPDLATSYEQMHLSLRQNASAGAARAIELLLDQVEHGAHD
jgi:lipid-A-disaccharide synthase